MVWFELRNGSTNRTDPASEPIRYEKVALPIDGHRFCECQFRLRGRSAVAGKTVGAPACHDGDDPG